MPKQQSATAIYKGDRVRQCKTFQLACLCVKDNAGEGVVIDHKGRTYAITSDSKRAKLITGKLNGSTASLTIDDDHGHEYRIECDNIDGIQSDGWYLMEGPKCYVYPMRLGRFATDAAAQGFLLRITA